MSEGKRLAKNTAIIAFGKMCTQFVSFLLLPLYTAVLSTSEYGVVDLITTYVSLLAPIVTLQLENAVFRYLIDRRGRKEKQSFIITAAFTSTTIALLIFSVLAVGANYFLQNKYLILLVGNVVACAYSNIMLQIARGIDDQIGYAMGSFLSASSTVVMNVIFIVMLHLGGTGMILAIMLGNVFCGVFLFLRDKVYRYIKIDRFSLSELKEMLSYSVPLIPNALSWWVMSASDRSVILFFLGTSWNGIYSAANKFSSIVMILYNIFNLSWTESIVLNIDKKESKDFISHSLILAFRFFSCACFGLIAIMPFVFPIMINKSYISAYQQIPILIVSALCNIVVGLYSAIYVAKKKTKEIAKTSMISAILNLVVHLSLIKFIGIYAASFSTLASSAIMMVWRYFDTKKYLEICIPKKDLIATLVSGLGIIIVYYIRNTKMCAVTLMVYIVYCVVVNRELLKSAFYIVKEKINYRRS